MLHRNSSSNRTQQCIGVMKILVCIDGFWPNEMDPPCSPDLNPGEQGWGQKHNSIASLKRTLNSG